MGFIGGFIKGLIFSFILLCFLGWLCGDNSSCSGMGSSFKDFLLS